jgi:serralysin
MTGGAGVDCFVFTGDDGKDTITTFEVSRDILAFEDEFFLSFADAMSHAHQIGKDMVFTFSDGDSVMLKGITMNAITVQNVGDLSI